MNYGNIKPYDIANGEGVRVSLFVSGCTHRCPGCFNRETWDFTNGQPFTDETREKLLGQLAFDYIDGLSLLGGEPFEPQNQRALLPLLREMRARLPGKTVWCYTGYTLERDLLRPSRARCECTDEMLLHIDVLVDGEFIAAQKDIRLAFRGSSNQRIIDLPATLRAGETRLYHLKSSLSR